MIHKIKVMHLASNPEWAGAEVHLATLAASLKTDNRVEISVTVFHNGKLVDYLKSQGIRVYILPLKWLFDITSVFKLARLLKDNNIDIIHTHGYKANLIGALASIFHEGTRCIRTEHGLTEPFFGFNKIKMNFYEGLDRLAGRLLTKKIISVSNDIRNNIASKYQFNSIRTIHNGIAISCNLKKDTKVIRKQLGIAENTFVIGIVGRLVPVKGHEYFINAARLVLHNRQDVKFLIVGNGPLRQELEKRVGDEYLNNHIIFTGFRDDVKDLISIMDIIVFSSLSEGIPYTLLEAMALNKPVIATNVGGLGEVISNGKNGLLVNSKDEKDIAEKCLYLLENKNIVEYLGEEAKKTVIDYFSVDRMKDETVRVYEEVIFS